MISRNRSDSRGRALSESSLTADYSNILASEHIKVFVRLRPPEDGSDPPADMLEINRGKIGSMLMRNPKKAKYGTHKFKFDNVFDHNASQEIVYRKVALPLVTNVLRGYNACCFAYGQTGSGKTYSVVGEGYKKKGILPRCIEQLFTEIKKKASTHAYNVRVCILEMYCDQIRDLGKAALEKNEHVTAEWFAKRNKVSIHGAEKDRFGDEVSSSKNTGGTEPEYRIYEDGNGQTFVRGAQYMKVDGERKLMEIVERSFRLRATHETNMNPVSSRSHTIVQISVESSSIATGSKVFGVLNVVDLAGSERVRKSSSEGQRLREALFINSSLSAIGKVIMALDPISTSETSYIPYRDSKLTRILQNSLGGNSYTTLLATIHPMASNYEECLSTLHFATHCRRVTNQVRVNRTLTAVDKDRQIRQLREEVAKLTARISYLQEALRKNTYNIMTQLHLQGEMLADGRFRMIDGRVVGDAVVNVSDDVNPLPTPSLVPSSPMSVNSVDTEPASRRTSTFLSPPPAEGSAATKYNMRAIAGNAVSTMQYMASQTAHREQIKKAKSKLMATRQELAKHQEEAIEMEKGLRQQLSQLQSRIQSAHEQIDEMKHEQEETLLEQKEAYEMQKQKLLANHNTVMRRTLSRQAKAMLATSTLRQTQLSNSASMARQADRDRHQQEMLRMTNNHMHDKKAQIEHLKQQCAHWMDKRDKQMKEYVSQLNNFYRRKRTHIQECHLHIANLYSLVDKMGTKLGMESTQMFGFTEKCPLREAMAPHFTSQLSKLMKAVEVKPKTKMPDTVSVRLRQSRQSQAEIMAKLSAPHLTRRQRRQRPKTAVARLRKSSGHMSTLRTLSEAR